MAQLVIPLKLNAAPVLANQISGLEKGVFLDRLGQRPASKLAFRRKGRSISFLSPEDRTDL